MEGYTTERLNSMKGIELKDYFYTQMPFSTFSDEILEKMQKYGLQEDIGESIYKVTEEGIFIMDICYQPGYHMLPMDAENFIIKCMEDIIKKMSEADEAYYGGNEMISNFEYDDMFDTLKKVEEETGIILDNSPTKKVSNAPKSEAVSGLKKVKHEFPMLSLDKTKDLNALYEKFLKGIDNAWKAGYDHSRNVLLMWKLDGSTIVCTFNKGKLETVATRGGGDIGSDITHNAKYIEGIPQTIPYDGKVIVRGEAVMSYKEFDRINEGLVEKYKNPRNLANSTISLLDSEEMRQRKINFKCFDWVYADNGQLPNLFSERFEILKGWGFDVVDYENLWIDDKEAFLNSVNKWTDSAATYDFPVDGLVFVMEDVMYSDTLPGTGHNPNAMRGYALKWKDETEVTTIKEIEWSASRTGLLNPVAIFDPVELEGTTVSRASIHNLSYIFSMDIKVGDEVEVYKANKIIPQIAINHNTEKAEMVYGYWRHERHGIPEKCPCCGGKTEVQRSEGNDGTYVLRCVNPECPAKHVQKFVHFCERDCMNVVGLSEATIEKFVNKGWLKEFSDIYTLCYDHGAEIAQMEGFGAKSVENLDKAIEASRHTTFVPFIHALGIPNIGKGQAKLLLPVVEKQYAEDRASGLEVKSESYGEALQSTLQKMVWEGFDFTSIEGIGEILAKSITDYFMPICEDAVVYAQDNEFSNLMNNVIFEDEPSDTPKAGGISGMTFVITGSLNTYKNRDELVAKIESLGGKVFGSVSAKTTYLINNDTESMSGKNKKAKELGIPIISEEEFNDMI